jgi:hypothetical protein
VSCAAHLRQLPQSSQLGWQGGRRRGDRRDWGLGVLAHHQASKTVHHGAGEEHVGGRGSAGRHSPTNELAVAERPAHRRARGWVFAAVYVWPAPWWWGLCVAANPQSVVVGVGVVSRRQCWQWWPGGRPAC